jgi:hypothetical protein
MDLKSFCMFWSAGTFNAPVKGQNSHFHRLLSHIETAEELGKWNHIDFVKNLFVPLRRVVDGATADARRIYFCGQRMVIMTRCYDFGGIKTCFFLCLQISRLFIFSSLAIRLCRYCENDGKKE